MTQLDLYPLQLVDVRLYEALIERFEPDESVETEEEAESESEVKTQLALGIDLNVVKRPSRHASVFLGLHIKHPSEQAPELCLVFVLEGLFESQVDLEDIGQELWQEFEDLSAINLLWPYARECMQNLTSRMRIDLPLLPTVNRLKIIRTDSKVGTGTFQASLDKEK